MKDNQLPEIFWRVKLRGKVIAVVKARTLDEAKRKAKASYLGQWVDSDISAEARQK